MVNTLSTYKSGNYANFIACKKCYGVGASKLEVVEGEILNALELKLQEIKKELNSTNLEVEKNESLNILEKTLTSLKNEEKELDKQKNKLHDLLERGVYDVDTFLERQQTLAGKKEEIQTAIKGTEKLINTERNNNIDYETLAKNIECALKDYKETDNIELKNKALKSVIKEVIYYKPKERLAQITLEVKFKI
jgi:chromosome segregation ATPase